MGLVCRLPQCVPQVVRELVLLLPPHARACQPNVLALPRGLGWSVQRGARGEQHDERGGQHDERGGQHVQDGGDELVLHSGDGQCETEHGAQISDELLPCVCIL
eukprot:404424_1